MALLRCVQRGQRLELMALISYAEARTYMHDVLLQDTDQMSMCHGLEVRVPFLDHELAELVVSLPDEPKMRGQGRNRCSRRGWAPGCPLPCRGANKDSCCRSRPGCEANSDRSVPVISAVRAWRGGDSSRKTLCGPSGSAFSTTMGV